MGYPFDDSFDIYGLSEQNRLQQLMQQNPYAGGLHTPGLMDSPAQPQENPFHGLFNPNYNQAAPPTPQVDPSAIPQSPSAEQTNPMDEYIKLMKEMYHPQTTASDRLNQLINSVPQHEKPSLGRMLVGVAGGLHGGYKESEEIMQAPYKQHMEEWKAQTTPAYQAAEVERQRNDAERTLTSNVISAKVAADKLKVSEAEGEKKRAAQEVIEARKAEAVQKRNDILEFKARHSDWKMDASGPTVITFDPSTGQAHDTKIQTKHLSDLDKITLEGGIKKEIAAANNASEERRTNITVNAANERSSEPLIVPQPDGTLKSYKYNKVTNTMEPITIGGEQVGGMNKVGTPGGKGYKGNQPKNLEAIQVMAKESLDALGALVDDKGILKPDIASVVGANRMNPLKSVGGGLPGTSYVTSNKAIKQAIDLVVLNLMGELKKQSDSGATGFGNMQRAEFQLLKDAASKLDPAMPQPDFEREVKRLRDNIQLILQPPSGTTTVKTPTTPEDYWKKYGGGGKP
jgi:hypothetical protein